MIGTEAYQKATSCGKDVEASWDGIYQAVDVLTYKPEFQKKLASFKRIDWEKIEFETKSAIENAQIKCLEKHLETIISTYNNDLREYLNKVLKHKTAKAKINANTTYETEKERSRLYEIDELMYQHSAHSYEELKARISPEEAKRLKL